MRTLSALPALALLSACAVVPRAEPPPPPAAPAPPVAVLPPPPPPPPPPEPAEPWDVAALSEGDWYYRPDGTGTIALFGWPQGDALFSIRCDPAGRRLVVRRLGAAVGTAQIAIRTSAGDISWPASVEAGQLGQATVATRPSGDQGFDWMAFSRGRFSVEVPGLARLILPAWPEMARVIEDCRA